MRILRQTLWTKPARNPDLIAYMRECDLKDPFDVAVAESRKAQPGAFIGITDFEMPGDPSIAIVSVQGSVNYYASESFRIERDQATLYHYNALYLSRVHDKGGVVANTIPHPLTAEQIQAVFEQLVAHPSYNSSKVMHGFGTDWKMVTLRNGKVFIDPKVLRPQHE